jgi:hypothetical protein
MGYFDEETGKYIVINDDGSETSTGLSYSPDLTNDNSGIGDMTGWKYVNGTWTDPRGVSYNLGDAAGSTLGSLGKWLSANKGLAAGAGAVASMFGLNKPNTTPTGYQGKIPQLTATRSMITAPPTMVDGVARRPGSAGINYGGDVVYTPKGIAAIAAPAETAPVTPPVETAPITPNPPDVLFEQYADGGPIGMAKGRYLQGKTDGMADKIPAQIGNNQPAALSHGEFVIPADVVSHLGNGNSDAGARKLYQMMDKIRMARTGNKKQGKKINPDKFMPGGLAQAYANGGSVQYFAEGGTPTGIGSAVNAGVTGTESNLSNWAGPYVTDMLGKGQALSETPYQAYTGQLTAGPSALQEKVSTGLGGLNFPGQLGQSFSSAGAYQPPNMAQNTFANQPIGTGAGATPMGDGSNQPSSGGIASQYMNPYLQSVLNPQLDELRRQSQMNLQPGLAKMTQAGGYGGGRQAIMESEANRNLLQQQNQAIGTGYANAFDKAQQQFNIEQGQANTLANMMAQQGATERGITSEGVAADKAAFEEARANPYKQVQFQQSLLQGLPLAAQSYNIAQPSALSSAAQGATTVNTLLKNLGL